MWSHYIEFCTHGNMCSYLCMQTCFMKVPFQETLHEQIFTLKQEKEELPVELRTLQDTVEGDVAYSKKDYRTVSLIIHLCHHACDTGREQQSVSGKKGETTELKPELSTMEKRKSEGQEDQLEIRVEPRGQSSVCGVSSYWVLSVLCMVTL